MSFSLKQFTARLRQAFAEQDTLTRLEQELAKAREAGQQAEEGGFTGTGAADDSQAIALVQFQAQFVQDSQFTFRAGNHFAKVPRGENACAHGESDANVVFECWPGLDVHGPERSGGYSPDRWR